MEKKRNLWVIPTDKPSRLHLWTDEKGTRPELCELEYSHTRNTQNIYITSDEEIKEGDWVLGDFPDNPIGKVIAKYGQEFTAQSLNGDKYGLAEYDSKKIILTTDQDLIKDGVQAIDDEFSEWFVKNPSCEYVEINKYAYAKPNFGNYKIIIPQEEPKQETTLEEHYLSIPKPLVDVLRMKVDNHPDKQETLEETAENFAIDKQNDKTSLYYIALESFKDGAKWQQEQDKKMYSEEEVLKAQQSILCNIKDALMNKNYIIEYLNN
jgi:hypothetical protein